MDDVCPPFCVIIVIVLRVLRVTAGSEPAFVKILSCGRHHSIGTAAQS